MAGGWSQWTQIGSISPAGQPYTVAERLHLVPMNFKSDRTASYSMSIHELIRQRNDKKPVALDLQSSVIIDPRSGGLQITPEHKSQPRRSRPDGSIGSRGGSYCRRSGSVRGWATGQPGIHHNGKPGLQIRANMTVDCKSAAAQSSHNDAQSMLKFSSPSGMA